MLKLKIYKGLPGSGKTTAAKKLLEEEPGKWVRVNKDDMRAMYHAGRWSKSNEKFILAMRDEVIIAALDSGFNVVSDDTNLHEKHIPHLQELVKGKAEVEIVDFLDVPIEECIRRDLIRPNSVGEKVIRKMYRDFLEAPVEPYLYNPLLPHCILLDMDGTAALLNGRDPYDASTCITDTPNEIVLGIVDVLRREYEWDIIVMSGRSEKDRQPTQQWLDRHNVWWENLYMRAEGDTRKDAVVKKELFDKHIRGVYNPRLALDDRDQMVALWRSMGIPCFQVNYGDF